MALGWVRDYLRRRQRLGAFSRHVSPSDLRSLLLGALDYANGRLYEQSGSHDDFVAGGTSLTAVLIAGHHALVAHVGDARAYLVRLGRLELAHQRRRDLRRRRDYRQDVAAGPRRRAACCGAASGRSRDSRPASLTSSCSRAIRSRCAPPASIAASRSTRSAKRSFRASRRRRPSRGSSRCCGRAASSTTARWSIGRDLLAGVDGPGARAPRREHRLKTIAALVMLVCAGTVLGLLRLSRRYVAAGDRDRRRRPSLTRVARSRRALLRALPMARRAR